LGWAGLAPGLWPSKGAIVFSETPREKSREIKN